MGIQSAGFPNLFTINAASVGNFVRAAEPLVDWVCDCIGYVRDHPYTRIAPTPAVEAAWTQHVAEAGAKILRTQADSWFVGANIPGKARFLLTSPDTAPVMRAKRAEVAARAMTGCCCNKACAVPPQWASEVYDIASRMHVHPLTSCVMIAPITSSPSMQRNTR